MSTIFDSAQRTTTTIYRALDLAKYLVTKCDREGQPISNLQLQKILYFIQKEFLQKNRLAFADDIEAWQFGPVVPTVYYHYCGAGAMPISVSKQSKTYEGITAADRRVIDEIVEAKRVLASWDLVEETHKVGGAWDRVYADGAGNHHTIPTQLIKERG